MSAGWSRCAPCSNRPTRRSPAANSRPSAAGCSRIIRACFASPGCRGSTARSAPSTRPPRSPTAFPAIGSSRSTPATALSRRRRRATNISRSSFRPSRRPRWSTGWIIRPIRERRATLERARDNDRVAAIRTRLYEIRGRRPAARRAGHRARLRQGNVARDGGRPAPQSGGFVVGDLRSAAAAAVDSRDDGGQSRRQHQRLSARSPGRTVSHRPDRCRIIRRLRQRRSRCRTSRRARTGRRRSGSAIPTWQVQAIPPPAVR